MFSPIYTIVKNTSGHDILVSWLNKQYIKLEKGAQMELPHDVWTMATPQQRRGIEGSCERQDVSIQYKVLTPDGVYTTVAFAPNMNMPKTVTVQPEAATAAAEETATVSAAVPETGGDIISRFTERTDHQVLAGTDEGSATARAYGLSVDAAENTAAGDSIIVESNNESITKDDAVVVEAGAVLAGETETVKAEQTVEPVLSIGERFDSLTAEKRWGDALELLVAEYGDKVNFTTRAIMSLKTFDAVDKKYKLSEDK